MSKLSAEPLAGDAKPPVGNAGGDDHRSRDERAAVREPQPIGVRGGARHHVQRAADAYYVTDIVLSIHARTAVVPDDLRALMRGVLQHALEVVESGFRDLSTMKENSSCGPTK